MNMNRPIRVQPPPPSRIKLGGIKVKPEPKRMPLTPVQARVLRSLGILDEPAPQRPDADVIGRAREFAEHAARYADLWPRTAGRPFLTRLRERPPPRRPSVEDAATLLAKVRSEYVMATAARLYGYDSTEELLRRRHHETTLLRERIAAMLHERGMSASAIGRLMGSPHSTVLGAIKRAKERAA